MRCGLKRVTRLKSWVRPVTPAAGPHGTPSTGSRTEAVLLTDLRPGISNAGEGRSGVESGHKHAPKNAIVRLFDSAAAPVLAVSVPAKPCVASLYGKSVTSFPSSFRMPSIFVAFAN